MRAREHRAVRHFLLFAFVAVLLEIIQILDRLIIQLVIYLSVSESGKYLFLVKYPPLFTSASMNHRLQN